VGNTGGANQGIGYGGTERDEEESAEGQMRREQQGYSGEGSGVGA
jgi:hypothetical protein